MKECSPLRISFAMSSRLHPFPPFPKYYRKLGRFRTRLFADGKRDHAPTPNCAIGQYKTSFLALSLSTCTTGFSFSSAILLSETDWLAWATLATFRLPFCDSLNHILNFCQKDNPKEKNAYKIGIFRIFSLLQAKSYKLKASPCQLLCFFSAFCYDRKQQFFK